MVTADVVAGMPAPISAWRAGACPEPPCTTWPISTSSTAAAAIPARAMASRITSAPSCGAVSGESPPRYRPMGVRTVDTRTGVVLSLTGSCRLGDFLRGRYRLAVDLPRDPRDESIDRNHVLLATGAARPKRHAVRVRLALAHHRHVGNLVDLRIAYPVVQRFAATVDVHPDAGRLEPRTPGARRLRVGIAEG